MEDSTIAAVPDSANRQHYEVPAEFFQASLGPKLKYSSCLWNKAMTLAEAEIEALAETCVHADLQDGQSILELGCGWGSLTLWMAEKYPHATITGVSNSASQRHYIEGQCRSRGLSNVTILTADMNDFDVDGRFDRIVSIEMFEHMRNWRTLLSRVRRWVHPDGRLMIHVFCHASDPYLFQDRGNSDWMARHFFSGGMMPSFDLVQNFADLFHLEESWKWDGTHYARTAEAWLDNLDEHRAEARSALTPGGDAARAVQRWRMFFMACAELFGMDGGQTWLVGHYRLAPSS